MKYPIGIQTFEKIRKDGFLYFDKTDLIYRLVHEGMYYFLSRPRRFGKSLLISTLEAYFSGRKDLFNGLAIEKLESQWQQFPILHLDLNSKDFTQENHLAIELDLQLSRWENLYNCPCHQQRLPEDRLKTVIEAAYNATGKQVVILVDEYDKPLLQTIDDEDMQDKNRRMLKAFYSVLKTQDRYIRFALLTGVTRFSRVSIFSDLNNLRDISMDKQYQALCGVTDEELDTYCSEPIKEMATENQMDNSEMRSWLRRFYDGYHFVENGIGIYNPFSILNALSSRRLKNYWFETGTPTFLTKLLSNNPTFRLELLSGGEQTANQLASIEDFRTNPLPIMFQTGYLTIVHYDQEFRQYTLDFPNDEVRKGFTEALAPYYLSQMETGSGLELKHFVTDAREGNIYSFIERLKALFSSLPYRIKGESEHDFQNSLQMFLMLIGLYVDVEKHTSQGRIDLVIQVPRFIYIIELKVDGCAQDALEQIKQKNYDSPHAMTGKQIYLIGVNYSTQTHTVDNFLIEERHNMTTP